MAELNYQAVLDQLTSPILVVDPRIRIVYANHQAAAFIGKSVAEVLGQPLLELLPPASTLAQVGSSRPSGFLAENPLDTRFPRHVIARKPDGIETVYELSPRQQGELGGANGGARLTTVTLVECPQWPESPGMGEPSLARGLKATAESAAASGTRTNRERWLNSVVEALTDDFGGLLARIWLRVDTGGGGLQCVAMSREARDDTNEDNCRDEVATRRVVRKLAEMMEERPGAIWSTPRIEHHDADARGSNPPRSSTLFLPLQCDDEPLGLIEFVACRPVTEEFFAALSAFAAIVAVTLRDMQLWEQARQIREESEREQAKLKAILDVLPVGVVVVEGQEGRISLVNAAAEVIGGAARSSSSSDVNRITTLQEFHKKVSLYDLKGGVYEDEARPLYRSLYRGESINETLMFRKEDGSEVLLEVSSAPFPGPHRGAVSAYRDVTEEHRLRSELAERAGQLKSLLDHLPVGVVYFDDEGVCRASNGPARKLLGLSRASVDRSTADSLFVTSPDLRNALARCIHEQIPYVHEGLPWANSAGSHCLRYLDWRFQPLPTVHAEKPGALGLIVDVTERKLAADRLNRAVEAAEQASRYKTQFLTAVSHDLRTPVNALSLQAEWLAAVADRQPAPDPELRPVVSDIRKATTNLIDLITDLLELTLFDSGVVEYQPSRFDLDAWLDSTLSPLKSHAAAKRLTLSWSVDRPGWTVHADRVKLGRVLVNLVGNAVKFTDTGSVEVRAGMAEDGGLRLVVQDTGPGIPRDQLERIFDEFAQLRNPERDRTKGTGLGLAISRRLVHGAGGRLLVESCPDQGSTFTAHYPPGHLVESPAPAQAPAAVTMPERADISSGSRPGSRGSILLVEDDPFSRRSLTRLLQRAGYEVEAVEDGRQAIESVNRAIPSLVLLDLMLPDMDGSEVLRRIRAVVDRATLPVVVLSGDVLSGRSSELRSLDVHGILSKPISFSELKAVLDLWISPPTETGSMPA